ncbi:MAG: hypothetical protein GC190_12025 [Alphaproteobacteria bacterium]|nr:hypothetical protein [Alphaproteobacteria bacterium]
MRSISSLSLLVAASIVAPASAYADAGDAGVTIQSSAGVVSETAAVNADLAASRPDLLISGNGFVFSTNASNTTLPGTTVAPMGRHFESAQRMAYYNNQLFNYFLAPPPDTRAYTDYFLLNYPGYVISTWTDRVAGVPSTGIGTATDQWTAAVYYMPGVHPTVGPDVRPDLDPMMHFRPRPELDERSSFHRRRYY